MTPHRIHFGVYGSGSTSIFIELSLIEKDGFIKIGSEDFLWQINLPHISGCLMEDFVKITGKMPDKKDSDYATKDVYYRSYMVQTGSGANLGSIMAPGEYDKGKVLPLKQCMDCVKEYRMEYFPVNIHWNK